MIENIHPGYNSVMVSLSSTAELEKVKAHVSEVLKDMNSFSADKPRTIEVPVAYGGSDGPDLEKIAKHSGLTPQDVIKRHSEGNYLVYFIGFSVGFPYLGGMDPVLATPRLSSPRKSVPKGAIGIAGSQTGIYPISSPGGWNLIGRTNLDIFNINAPDKSLLRMGDNLKFTPVNKF